MRTGKTALLATVATLALPAASQAATWIVDPASPAGTPSCSGADTTCHTINDALSASAAGDTIAIAPGTYAERLTIPASKSNLTIIGANPIQVRITGDLSDNPVIQIDTGSVLTTLANVSVVHAAGTATPAINADDGLRLRNSAVVSSRGPALIINHSSANEILRSSLFATATDTDAVQVNSASDDPSLKKLTIDSSILSGGPGGEAAGLRAHSFPGGGALAGSEAGDIQIVARHLTTAGQAKGIVLDAQANGSKGLLDASDSNPKGSISATVANSIVQGPSQVDRYNGDLTHSSNNATLTFVNSDAPQATGNAATGSTRGQYDFSGGPQFVDAARKNFHLRADAPDIDLGTPPAADDSSLDVDGNPRSVDGPDADTIAETDLGADEWVNRPPVARLVASATTVRQNRGITFDASGSRDPESGQGGRIVSYRFDYGDGSAETFSTPTALHAYRNVGTYTVRLTVTDNFGARGVSAPITVRVLDGLPPEVDILSPRPGQKFRLSRRSINLNGTARDASGLDKVELAVRLVRRSRASTSASQCSWFDGKRRLRHRSCRRPLFFRAGLSDIEWFRRISRRAKLPAGKYELRVRATDKAGNQTETFSGNAGTLVRFYIK